MDTLGILKRDLTSKTIQILDTKWILKWDPKRIQKWIPKGVPLWSLFGSKKYTIFGIHFIPKWDPHGIHFGSIVLLGSKLERINNLHPSLTFTVETEKEKGLPFLDMLVKNNGGTLSSSW